MPLPSIGGAQLISYRGGPCIKMLKKGHANRPFFHIVVTDKFARIPFHPVEQIGTYDPMANTENQKLLSLSIERTRYWMGQGATFSRTAAKLLGRAGFLPIHPRSYMETWRYRYKEAADAIKVAEEKAAGDNNSSQPPSSSSSST